MPDNKRLDAIVNRVIELEWDWDQFWSAACSLAYMDCTPPVETVYTIAERLLAAFEPGPVVELCQHREDCCTCGLDPLYCEYAKLTKTGFRKGYEPGPNCPGLGKYKLIKVNDV
jgi:hypothetical protein